MKSESRSFFAKSSLKIKNIVQNPEWAHLSLLWFWTYLFINKDAKFPSDTGGDARKDLYEEWHELLSCIENPRKRFVFSIRRSLEAIMIGYDYNRIGLLATLRGIVWLVQRFIPKNSERDFE